MPAGFAFLQVYKLKPPGPQPLPALVRMLQHPHKQLGTINIVYHTSFIVPLMYKPPFHSEPGSSKNTSDFFVCLLDQPKKEN